MVDRSKEPFAWVPQAKQLLEDGASYREVAKTVNIDRRHVSRTLPGYGWTQSEGGKFAKMKKNVQLNSDTNLDL